MRERMETKDTQMLHSEIFKECYTSHYRAPNKDYLAATVPHTCGVVKAMMKFSFFSSLLMSETSTGMSISSFGSLGNTSLKRNTLYI